MYLDMPWPDHASVARPTDDHVRIYAKNATSKGVNRADLVDWYPPEDLPTGIR